jgi:predicted O-linked N-acetylglucosamine transferase (SPINDLY family)
MDIAATLQSGLALHRAGRLAEAGEKYEQVLTVDGSNFECLHLAGLVAFQLGRPEEAVERLRRALKVNGKMPAAYNNYGVVLNILRRHKEAVAAFEAAIALAPNYAEAHLNRGRALGELDRLKEAIESFERAIVLNSSYAEAFNDRGKAYAKQLAYKEALEDFERAVLLKPDLAEGHFNLGLVLTMYQRDVDAAESFGRAVALQPNNLQAHKERANAFFRSAQWGQAVRSFDRVLELDTTATDSLISRGIALQRMGRPEDALQSYDRAIAIDPDMLEAHANRGSLLGDLKRYAEALAAGDRAAAVQPENAAVQHNRGIALEGLGRIEEAIEAYDLALTYDPSMESVAGKHLDASMKICRWDDYAEDCKAVLKDIDAGFLASPPFPLLATPATLAQQQRAAELYVQRHVGPVTPHVWSPRKARGAKLHVGYFSADFYNHATAYLTAGMFEAHNRADFEITAFSFGRTPLDEMGRRLNAAFDRFIDVADTSDHDIAARARDLGVDIAVDVKGLTFESRPGIFAHRAAPIQASWLAYPGTMGLAAMDYLIADPVLIPEEHRAFYTEKIAYLPPSYQVNDSKRAAASRVYTRGELGLPADAFVFANFNNTWKLSPAVFDVWMRLLGKVPDSVLWLLEGPAAAAKNLRQEAETRGIPGDRLIFAPRIAPEEHLARHAAADLFLDTIHYNAHTTASDALWTGLPLVTTLGDTFAGRVSASLLTAIGLEDLIAPDLAAYEALALELATHPEKLSALRQRLQRNRTTHGLFDTTRFTRNMEEVYRRMWSLYDAGGSPAHIFI